MLKTLSKYYFNFIIFVCGFLFITVFVMIMKKKLKEKEEGIKRNKL